MNGVIDFLTKLGNVPIVNILLGAFLVSFVTYLFTGKQKKIHEEKVTKQVLSFVNVEVRKNIESFANEIYSKYPYHELNLKGLELICTQAGNIKINDDRLAIINEIYTRFDEINKMILGLREEFYIGSTIAQVEIQLELQKLKIECADFIVEHPDVFWDFLKKVLLNKKAGQVEKE